MKVEADTEIEEVYQTNLQDIDPLAIHDTKLKAFTLSLEAEREMSYLVPLISDESVIKSETDIKIEDGNLPMELCDNENIEHVTFEPYHNNVVQNGTTNQPTNTQEQNTMNDQDHDHEKNFWNYKDGALLIDIVETKYDDLYDVKKRKNVWNVICAEMQSRGVQVTPKICYKKWRNLIRTYKTCKNSIKKGEKKQMRFHFFNKMENLLDKKSNISFPHSINTLEMNQTEMSPVFEMEIIQQNVLSEEQSEPQPESLLEPQPTEQQQPTEQSIPMNSTSPSTATKPRKKHKTANIDYINSKKRFFELKYIEWEKRREEKTEREERKMKLYERKLDLEERKIKVLEALVSLRKNSELIE